MEDALAFLRDAGKGHRRIAVLGDMRELGSAGEEAHISLVPLIREATDHAILIGPQMAEFCALRLQELGASFESFPTLTAARDAIRNAAAPSSEKSVTPVVLVKGSQNTLFLERAVQMLLADPTDAAKLCRRGAMWDGLRANTQ
jgi:UDP-N-acetylmuramoyl-tripeptide--D-alanyl-D-alanine ligase